MALYGEGITANHSIAYDENVAAKAIEELAKEGVN